MWLLKYAYYNVYTIPNNDNNRCVMYANANRHFYSHLLAEVIILSLYEGIYI